MEFDKRLKIRDNDRFYTAKVSQSQTDFFYKLSKTEEIAKQIKKQVNGAKLIDQILGTNEDSWLRAERIVYSGDEWLLAEWLDGGPLATPEQYRAGENLQTIDSLVKIQGKFDKHAEGFVSDQELRVGGRTLLSEAEKKLEDKLYPLVDEYKWDKSLIDTALNYWLEKSKFFTPALQHGDLTPWHVFKDGGNFVLIDCEHADTNWPRYYDIANFYSALNTRFNLASQSQLMAQNFSNSTGVNLIDNESFKGLVVMRNLFRLFEHKDDPEVVDRILSFTKDFTSK